MFQGNEMTRLTQIKELIDTYRPSLENSQILIDKICFLLNEGFNVSADDYDRDQLLSDSNQNEEQALYEFVQEIGQLLSPQKLHQVTEHLIKIQFGVIKLHMNQLTVEKAFLAYEMLHSPDTATSHFDLVYLKRHFSTPARMSLFKELIMHKFIKEFELIERFPNLPKNEAQYLMVLDELQNKIKSEENVSIREISEGLIARLKQLKGVVGWPMGHINKILTQTLFLLEGRISPLEYAETMKLIPGQKDVQSTYGRKMAGGAVFVSGALLAAVTGGVGLFFGAGLAAAGARMVAVDTTPQPQDILGGMQKLTDTVASENISRLKVQSADFSASPGSYVAAAASSMSPHKLQFFQSAQDASFQQPEVSASVTAQMG